MGNLLSELRQWRNNQARLEGVEGYRVLSNTVLEALVGALPKNKEALLGIKGIKEAKCGKYGATLLRMIAEHTGGGTPRASFEADKGYKMQPDRNALRNEAGMGVRGEKQSIKEGAVVAAVVLAQEVMDQTLSVSEFLDGLNVELSGMAARIQGEVSSVDVRERVVYFTIKDLDESTLNCLIFRRQYDISGVGLAIGDEVIVEGAPDIYKPSGRLSLKVGMIELCGEGALKKAYDALKLRLEQEGLFAPEKKRMLPRFPRRIALI
ncbi:MAG: exodeoxyribonuclease VII large subunit, partial [Candidatus Moranbacteria bacterium]|nr:exodeoxyribonuclease VII large subunit [Candidatus Moranbacteria bacterium]